MNQPPNYRWEVLENVVVIRARPGGVEERVFKAFLDDLRNSSADHVFAIAAGVATLTPVQRRSSAEEFKAKNIMTQVVTDSALTRGIVTAVSWLGANITSYSWKDLEKAFTELGASPAVESRLRELADAFRKEGID
ncbi:MAG: hypothetical protein K0V04_10145 [Deltaproteobacteria bacterium]|nr:hypothetical protein [Deltaproteobacteria bacterium]